MPVFVTVASFSYVHETLIPKATLESEGILCFVRDELSMFIQPFFSLSSGIKLQVGENDAEDAIRILRDSGYSDRVIC